MYIHTIHVETIRQIFQIKKKMPNSVIRPTTTKTSAFFSVHAEIFLLRAAFSFPNNISTFGEKTMNVTPTHGKQNQYSLHFSCLFLKLLNFWLIKNYYITLLIFISEFVRVMKLYISIINNV